MQKNSSDNNYIFSLRGRNFYTDRYTGINVTTSINWEYNNGYMYKLKNKNSIYDNYQAEYFSYFPMILYKEREYL